MRNRQTLEECCVGFNSELGVGFVQRVDDHAEAKNDSSLDVPCPGRMRMTSGVKPLT